MVKAGRVRKLIVPETTEDYDHPIMRRILIMGGSGQTGSRLCKIFPDDQLMAPPHSELDLSNETNLRDFLKGTPFHTILIPGGMTDPAQCEKDPHGAFAANSRGPEIIAEEAQGAHVIYFSTDYVFNGKSGPYSPDAIPDPISVYGKTKWEGEKRIQRGKWAIIRTCHIFSADPGNNFFMYVTRNLLENRPVHAYQDQFSTPTDVETLVEETARIVKEEKEGIFHLSGKETCSRYEFAKEISNLLGIKGVVPAFCPEEGRPKKVGLLSHLPSWREGVLKHVKQIKENGLPKART